MCLMLGLIESNLETKYDFRIMDVDKIAYYYTQFIASEPFDMNIA